MAGELQKELREVNSFQAPYANDVVLKRCHAAADYIDRLEADKRELVEALRRIRDLPQNTASYGRSEMIEVICEEILSKHGAAK